MLCFVSFDAVIILGEEDKLTRITKELEERIKELEEKVNKVERRLNDYIRKLPEILGGLFIFFGDAFDILSYARSILAMATSMAEGELADDVETGFSRIKNFYEIFSKSSHSEEMVGGIELFCKEISRLLIDAAYLNEMEFDELLAIIVETLGKELASKIIDEAVILRTYGSDAVTNFKNVLRKLYSLFSF